jgi:hypothetical protein
MDPDCHYFFDSAKLDITTAQRYVPDSGATAVLLGGATLGLGCLARRIKK